MLEAPVRVRARGTHDLYELIAADPVGGVLQVTLPLRPPLLGDRIVLELLEPAPAVHLMAEVAGPSQLPCTPDTRFVDVKWLVVLAAQRRSYLARALEEILGIRAHLRTDDDELGPQRRLIYDVAAQQIRLVNASERALDETLLDLRSEPPAADPTKQTQPRMLVETDPKPRAASPFATQERPLGAPIARPEPTPRPFDRPEPTPLPTAGRRPVYADEALFQRPVTLRDPEPPRTPPPSRPTTSPGAAAGHRSGVRSPITLDGTTGARRPLFEREPGRGYFTWRDATLAMVCSWIGHSHCVFVVPSIEAIQMGEVIRAALPGDPITDAHVQVVGVVSRLKPDAATGRLMVELDLTGHSRHQAPEYRRVVQYWAVRQRS